MHIPLLSLATFATISLVAATTITHVHTITVQQTLATARPFGKHSDKHSKHHRHVDSRKHDRGSWGKQSSTASDCSHEKPAGHKHKQHGSSSKNKGHKTKVPATKISSSHYETSTKARPPPISRPATTSKSTQASEKPVETHSSTPPLLVATPNSQLARDSLNAHNELRQKHKVGPLTWSNELASAAQDWTDKCIYQHGKGKEIGAGENIAAYYGGGSDVLGAISMWSNEASLYNWAAPGYAEGTGHFTQQVWKATTEIGCAQSLCPTLTMPGNPSWTNAYFYVCEYRKGGNVVGQTPELTAKYFSENVFPA
ncbi:uncharacterized protein JCM15063_002879 [Sporobolomyces koalae]|uniref:uncharacterized protein n=1 Tax=Sporobolomyces koalae TaxID=500713 RepID=UPI00316FB760